MLKFFSFHGTEVGVAIEMDHWMVHRDLLKFRRGVKRGQIIAGAIIQPNYRETFYCFEHFRYLNEPLFGEIPIVYCCPRGPGRVYECAVPASSEPPNQTFTIRRPACFQNRERPGRIREKSVPPETGSSTCIEGARAWISGPERPCND
jgi:hypothetical protein